MLEWEGMGMAMFLVSYPNTVANWCGKVSDVHLVIVNPKKIVWACTIWTLVSLMTKPITLIRSGFNYKIDLIVLLTSTVRSYFNVLVTCIVLYFYIAIASTLCPVAAALLPGPWPGLPCRKFGRAWYIISRVMLDNRKDLVVCGALCSVQSYQ